MSNTFVANLKDSVSSLLDKIKSAPKKAWEGTKAHFKKQEIKRRWRTRLIIVLLIGAFVGSLYIKNSINMWPYKSKDFLTVSGNTIMDGDGNSANGIYRLNQFMMRASAGEADDIRIITYTAEGYMIKNDLSVDVNGNITLVIDNKKNKMLEKEERKVKQTLEFVRMGTEIERSMWRHYKLYAKDGVGRTIYSEIMG